VTHFFSDGGLRHSDWLENKLDPLLACQKVPKSAKKVPKGSKKFQVFQEGPMFLS